MGSRSFRTIVASGSRVSRRELFKALKDAGCEVIPTSKSTHWKVRRGDALVIIATRGDEVLPTYLSRVAQVLGFREGTNDE